MVDLGALAFQLQAKLYGLSVQRHGKPIQAYVFAGVNGDATQFAYHHLKNMKATTPLLIAAMQSELQPGRFNMAYVDDIAEQQRFLAQPYPPELEKRRKLDDRVDSRQKQFTLVQGLSGRPLVANHMTRETDLSLLQDPIRRALADISVVRSDGRVQADAPTILLDNVQYALANGASKVRVETESRYLPEVLERMRSRNLGYVAVDLTQ